MVIGFIFVLAIASLSFASLNHTMLRRMSFEIADLRRSIDELEDKMARQQIEMLRLESAGVKANAAKPSEKTRPSKAQVTKAIKDLKQLGGEIAE